MFSSLGQLPNALNFMCKIHPPHRNLILHFYTHSFPQIGPITEQLTLLHEIYKNSEAELSLVDIVTYIEILTESSSLQGYIRNTTSPKDAYFGSALTVSMLIFNPRWRCYFNCFLYFCSMYIIIFLRMCFSLNRNLEKPSIILLKRTHMTCGTSYLQIVEDSISQN